MSTTIQPSSSSSPRVVEANLDPVAREIVDRLLAGERLISDHLAATDVDMRGRVCLIGALGLLMGVVLMRPLGVDVSTAIQSLALFPPVILAGYGAMRLVSRARRFAQKTLLPLLACELLRLVPSQHQVDLAHRYVRRNGARLGRLLSAKDLKKAITATAQSLGV